MQLSSLVLVFLLHLCKFLLQLLQLELVVLNHVVGLDTVVTLNLKVILVHLSLQQNSFAFMSPI